MFFKVNHRTLTDMPWIIEIISSKYNSVYKFHYKYPRKPLFLFILISLVLKSEAFFSLRNHTSSLLDDRDKVIKPLLCALTHTRTLKRRRKTGFFTNYTKSVLVSNISLIFLLFYVLFYFDAKHICFLMFENTKYSWLLSSVKSSSLVLW